MINRRNLVGAAALGLAGAAATFANPKSGEALSGPAISRSRRRFNMVTTWPKGLPGLGRAAERFSEFVLAMSDGLIEVKVFAAGELVPPFESFDAVANGSADIYHGAEYYWTAKSTGFPFFTAVPFGMTAQEIMGWIDHGGGQELWDELSGQFGIKCLQGANTGHQMGGWFRREITGLNDFVGLKMRIPGQGGDVLRALGGASIALAGGEIYQALQTGAIDATEWVGPWNDYALGQPDPQRAGDLQGRRVGLQSHSARRVHIPELRPSRPPRARARHTASFVPGRSGQAYVRSRVRRARRQRQGRHREAHLRELRGIAEADARLGGRLGRALLRAPLAW
jgi:TRAP-type mannitol/chloroaromatic compound transport system substrate-binding protein